MESRILLSFSAPVAPPVFAVGADPQGVAVGDVTGTGQLSVVTANEQGNSVSVLQGDGHGGFLPAVSYATAVNPAAVSIADLNGDGHKDIAVVAITGSVSVLLGTGTGTFLPAANYAIPTLASSIAVGDLNHDGHVDIITSRSLLLGNGDGTFQAATPLPVSGHVVALGDFNGDGNLDLAAADEAVSTPLSDVLTIALGNGDGTFQAPQTFNLDAAQTTGAQVIPKSIALADLNGDGHLDVAVANEFGTLPGRTGSIPLPGSVSVLLGNGLGGFQPATNYGTGEGDTAVVATDFNGDGHKDLIVNGVIPSTSGSTPTSDIQIFTGNGDGTFSPAQTHALQPGQSNSMAAGDFNGDGHDDLVSTFSGNSFGAAGSASVLFLNGASTFGGAPPQVALPGRGVGAIVAGDFNGDGLDDLIAVNNTPGAATNLEVLLSNGDGSFRDAGGVIRPTAGAAGLMTDLPTVLAKRDINGDGKLDLIVGTSGFANSSPATIDIYLGNGDGTFQMPIVMPVNRSNSLQLGPDRSEVIALDLADVNGDGITDIKFETEWMSFALLFQPVLIQFNTMLGNPDGTFQPAFEVPDPSTTEPNQLPLYWTKRLLPAFATVADVNQDGRPDLVSVQTGLTVGLDFGDSAIAGTYGDTLAVNGGPNEVAVAAGDFNGDGLPDIAVSNGVSNTFSIFGVPPMASGQVTIDLNSGWDYSYLSNAVTFKISAPTELVVGQALGQVTATAVDAQGNAVPNYVGEAHLDGDVGRLPSDPVSPFQSYIASHVFPPIAPATFGTFSFSSNSAYLTAGQHLLSVSEPGMTTAFVPVTVLPGAMTHFQITPTGTVTAGTPFTFTVSPVDKFGNVGTKYTGTVHFSAAAFDTNAILPADYTFTPADAGKHTFTATLFRTAAPSVPFVGVTDTATGIGTSDVIDVHPLAPISLKMTTSTNQTSAGGPLGLTVSAVDIYGNVTTGSDASNLYTGTVHFTSSDPKAQLPADYTFTSLDHGVHTFSPIFNTAGVQSVTVTDTGNAALASTAAGIAVAPGFPSTFVVSGISAATAGVAQTYTIAAYDRSGNLATNFTGALHFTSSDARATLAADYVFTAADAGIHAFSVTMRTAGNQTLTAQDGGLVASTQSVVVNPGAAASFMVNGFPATTAGVAHTFTVTVVDGYGNLVTGYAGTVTFLSSDSLAGLPAAYAFTQADGGVHTFAATLRTAGTQSISVIDTSAATVFGTQSGIVVVHAAAVQFSISVPAGVTTGTSFTIAVMALDAFGNLDPTYRGKFHFSSTGSAGLPSDYTFGATDNGSHVFSVTLNTVGLETLTLVDLVNPLIKGSVGVTVGSKPSGGTGGTGGGGGGGGSGSGGGKTVPA